MKPDTPEKWPCLKYKVDEPAKGKEIQVQILSVRHKWVDSVNPLMPSREGLHLQLDTDLAALYYQSKSQKLLCVSTVFLGKIQHSPTHSLYYSPFNKHPQIPVCIGQCEVCRYMHYFSYVLLKTYVYIEGTCLNLLQAVLTNT